jgi:hypothetical protein
MNGVWLRIWKGIIEEDNAVIELPFLSILCGQTFLATI